MMTYAELRGDRRRLLALTGLTPPEFDRVLTAFTRSYGRRYPADRTAAGRPRQRRPGGGRGSVLHGPEQQLLVLLGYLQTYPPQPVMAQLFRLSPPPGNRWVPP